MKRIDKIFHYLLRAHSPSPQLSLPMHKLEPARFVLRNLLLNALPQSELDRLLPDLQLVSFSLGQILCESGERINYCYFPINAVVSLLYTMQDGSTAEMGLVGNEGVFGVAAFLGGESTCSTAIVAVAGDALRVPAQRLQKEFAQAGPLQNLLLRYAQSLITQVSQTAVCNRLHSVEQRLCRWLLLCHDRKNCSELLMTQELIANMLGGRRESVTVAARRLQDAGLIRYCRGRIAILDRGGLEISVCECYRAVENEVNRLFGRRRESEFSSSGGVLAAAAPEAFLADQSCRPELAKRNSQRPLQHLQRDL
jgi:CRP-like cAMP-binding protein